ncbi:MAG: ABC transporter substrate-binding protein [Sulfolobales archaeon]
MRLSKRVYSILYLFVISIVLISVLSILSTISMTPLLIAQALPRDKTLYIVGVTSAFGDSFNPFSASAPGVDLVLPPLFAFNFVTDTWYPILANWTWENDTTLVIKIYPEATWEDGTPVKADDVIFTFNTSIRERCSDILYWCRALYTPGASYFVGWEKVDDKTVKLYINSTAIRAYRTIPWVFASWIRLAPSHIFLTQINSTDWIKNKFYDPSKKWPVGAGPYRLYYFDPSMVVYERKDDWWGWKYIKALGVKLGVLKPDEPYPTDSYPPKYIVWRAQPSADLARAALIAGEADIIGTVVPGISAYTKQGLGAWFDSTPWYHPYAAWTVFIQHIPPINILEVKRAVFLAIQRDVIASKTNFGFNAPPDDPIGLPNISVYRAPPYYDYSWIVSTFKSIYGVSWPLNHTEAVAAAKKLLDSATINGTKLFVWDDTKKRFVWNVDITLSVPGYTVTFKKGDELTLTFITGSVPSPDDAAVLDQLRRDLADVGITLNIYLSPDPWNDFRIRCLGHFTMATYFIAWTPGPPPRALPGQFGFVDPAYNETHTIAQAFPCGTAPPYNPGRYNNTNYSAWLEQLPRVPLTDVENNTRILRGIMEEFLKDPPFIAVALVPIGATYSTQYWVGYPTYKNPYATPWYDFTARSGYLTYLFLKPAARPTPTPVTVTLPPTTVVQVQTATVATVVTQIVTSVMTTPVVQTMVTTVAGTPVTQVVTTQQVVTTAIPTEIIRTVVTERPVTIVSTATPPVAPPAMPEWVLPTIVVLVIVIIALGVLLVIRRR